jgi:hypothetical protein
MNLLSFLVSALIGVLFGDFPRAPQAAIRHSNPSSVTG